MLSHFTQIFSQIYEKKFTCSRRQDVKLMLNIDFLFFDAINLFIY